VIDDGATTMNRVFPPAPVFTQIVTHLGPGQRNGPVQSSDRSSCPGRSAVGDTGIEPEASSAPLCVNTGYLSAPGCPPGPAARASRTNLR
jgi:hypothetical protein